MRLLLIVLLSLVAAPAWAEWVEVARHDEAVFYIDFARMPLFLAAPFGIPDAPAAQ